MLYLLPAERLRPLCCSHGRMQLSLVALFFPGTSWQQEEEEGRGSKGDFRKQVKNEQ